MGAANLPTVAAVVSGAMVTHAPGELKKAEIPALTGVRFIAAAFVAVAHFNIQANVSLWGYDLNASAPLGMSLFFCLSGFIIHYVYGEAFVAGGAAWSFFIARASRLYPLFLTVFLVALLYHPELSDALCADPWRAISYLTLTGTWWYWQYDGKILVQLPAGITWSIATEWFFYFIYALCLYPIFRIRSIRFCIGLLAAVLGVAYISFWVVHFYWPRWEPFILDRMPDAIAVSEDWVNSFFRWAFYASPYARLFEFMGGCLSCQLYFLLRRSPDNLWRSEILFWAGAAWLVAALWIFVVAGSPEGEWLRALSPVVGFLMFTHMNCLFAPGILLMLLALALGCRASYLLGLTPVVFLGEISYSIYLGHPYVAGFALVSIDSAYPLLGIGFDLFLTCVLAVGFYSSIERPAKRWLRHYLDPALFHGLAGAIPPSMRRLVPANAVTILVAAVIGIAAIAHVGNTLSEPQANTAPSIAPPGAVNLVVSSEKFSDSAWRLERVSIEENAEKAPDGANTATRLVELRELGLHRIEITASGAAPGAVHTLSVYVKPTGRSRVMLEMRDNKIGKYGTVGLDVGRRTVLAKTNDVLEAGILPQPNGWFRCWAAMPLATDQAVFNLTILGKDGGANYSGDGKSGLLIWGAQLEPGRRPTNYLATLAGAISLKSPN
jgi:peptidoglycan/LPS O-acetylase OafA/YrhL